MAKKGQKFNKYTAEYKAEILEKYFCGKYTARMLSKEYEISIKTIETWIRAYKQGKPVSSTTHQGRSKSSEIDYKERYEILKKFQAFVQAQRKKK